MAADNSLQKLTTAAQIWRVATKEVTLFFASPVAWLFLAAFAGTCLFIFFWGESFFARNIADVRPLFEWMPILLIFLCSALTMRLWSEERRSGTLEHIITQAAPLWQFVVGKFLGCLLLLLVAILIVLPLPLTVSIISDLDWGPVCAGMLATILLGAAYLGIGLFISAKSDNQIVSLILSVAVCSAFYLIGHPLLLDLVGNQSADILRQLGTGSRFESITRGVIDLRDLYYYLSLVLVFLVLNTWVLERESWAAAGRQSKHQRYNLLAGLLVANFLLANLWLQYATGLRVDTTKDNQYSISAATHNYLKQLQEPLLLRGYFSNKTHPLLAPLVPQLQDLLREYEIAGGGRVRLEFVDPLQNPEVEKEANKKYGIQPVPFQIEDRYQSSVVSSYFNILVQYGDETVVLGFSDLIDIQVRAETRLEVLLRNPEYDITSAIKRCLRSYRSGGDLFAAIDGSLQFTAYVSADELLPEKLQEYRKEVARIATETEQESGGKFQVQFVQPEQDDGRIAQQILENYGFRPMTAGLFDTRQFYFYLVLAQGDQALQIGTESFDQDSFARNLRAGIKRFDTGFARTVGLVVPRTELPGMPQNPMAAAGDEQFTVLEQTLGSEHTIKRLDLMNGVVPGDVDILVVAGAIDLSDTEIFAIDQFLMQGGTIIAATSPYTVALSRTSMSLLPQESGLQEWLSHHGLSMSKQLVMDPQNAKFPVPVNRDVGGFQIQEIRMLDYPWFVDVRREGMVADTGFVAGLPQLLLPWASPITLGEAANTVRTTVPVLQSSADAWVSESKNILPQLDSEGRSIPFLPEGETATQLLGVLSSGVFTSWFADKESPLIEALEDNAAEAEEMEIAAGEDEEAAVVSSVIEKSRESARIILISSSEMLRDQTIQLLSSVRGSNYRSNFQLIANAVDWSLEDAGLLSIRARGRYNRALPPLSHGEQLFWEYLNYGLVVLALLALVLGNVIHMRRRQARYARLLKGSGTF